MSNDFWLEGKTAALSLTFDDARLSQVDQGLPLLDAYGGQGNFLCPRFSQCNNG